MKAREYLKQLELMDTLIEQKMEELDSLKASINGTKGLSYEGDRVQTSPQNSQEAIICKYMDLNEEINAEIDNFAETKHQMINQIQSLGDQRYVKLLYKIYVQYKTVYVASLEMCMSYNYVCDLHKQALDRFDQMYPDLSPIVTYRS